MSFVFWWELKRKVEWLMATVAELQTGLENLEKDLESVATAAIAEFKKLEEEVAKGSPITPAMLDPLKAKIEEIDTKTKGVKVPTA